MNTNLAAHVDELAEALRPILGPFQLQVGRQAVSRTDALFDQLDRDKDSQLTRPELAAIAADTTTERSSGLQAFSSRAV